MKSLRAARLCCRASLRLLRHDDLLGPGATIDIERGIEEPGGGRLYVEPGIGTFMLGGGSTPTITRYEVNADGSLERGAVLSFANQGVSDLADGAIVFVE